MPMVPLRATRKQSFPTLGATAITCYLSTCSRSETLEAQPQGGRGGFSAWDSQLGVSADSLRVSSPFLLDDCPVSI